MRPLPMARPAARGWGEGVRELPLIEWVIIAAAVVAFIGMFVALNRILKG